MTVTDCQNPKFKQQSFALDSTYNARYVKLTVTKVGLPISGQNSYYLQLAEFDVYYNSLLSSANATSTPYGPISEKYSDVNKYPFALFMDGEFKGAYTHWANTDDNDTNNGGSADNYDVLQQAKGLIHGADGAGKTVYIMLRRDYALDSTEYSVKDGTKVNENYGNFSQVGGTLVVDLGGNTLTLGAERFLTANAKATSSVVHDSAFEFKNGTIELNSQAMIYYQSTNTLTASKNFDFKFDNVTFVLPQNKQGVSLITQGNFSGTATVNAKIDFVDCTFDYSSGTKAVLLILWAMNSTSKSLLACIGQTVI